MNQVIAALDAVWRVLAIALLLGAGLPTLFAFGIRAFAWGTGGDAEEHTEGVIPRGHLLGRVVGCVLFGVVVLAVMAGIAYIAAHGMGWVVTFDGIVPVLTPKD